MKHGIDWTLEALDVSHDTGRIPKTTIPKNDNHRIRTQITTSVKIGQGTLVNVVISPAAASRIIEICLQEVGKALENA